MIAYEDIRLVEVELSSNCIATCPLCSRNLFGHNKDMGFAKTNITLDKFKIIFSPAFLKQLKKIIFQGNFGDPSSNRQTPEIVEYILDNNSSISIEGHTHGSLQSTRWWERLHPLTLFFGLDGLEDTHNLYRKNTNFNKAIENATAFVNAGGKAFWKMIEFDHNRHQIGACETMAKELGMEFQLIRNAKGTGPVFNHKKEYTHSINNFSGSKIFEDYVHEELLLEDIDAQPTGNIKCMALKTQGIFVQSNGEVYPCCYMAHYPRTYRKGGWAEPFNKQLLKILGENNALEKGIESSIEWFSSIPQTWDIKNFEDGRLLYCDQNCGNCKNG